MLRKSIIAEFERNKKQHEDDDDDTFKEEDFELPPEELIKLVATHAKRRYLLA